MVGQVANVLIVREGDSKGEGVITRPRCSACDSCTLTIVISKREGENRRLRQRVLGATNSLCNTGKMFTRNTVGEIQKPELCKQAHCQVMNQTSGD